MRKITGLSRKSSRASLDVSSSNVLDRDEQRRKREAGKLDRISFLDEGKVSVKGVRGTVTSICKNTSREFGANV